MKIIHILCHTIPLKRYFVFDGWPARNARAINKYSSAYKHECWYAIRDIKKPMVWYKDNIKFRLFPAWTLNTYLESFLGIVVSKSLIKALKKETKSKRIVIHIQGERGLLVWQVINVAKGIPIFLQFHGYSTPDFLLLFERLLITPFERYFFSFVDYFFVHFKCRIKYLIEKCQVSETKIYNQNLGVDYNLFKPLNKIQARKKLGLPLDKNIIFYLGIFNRTKGVNKIVEAHLKVKKKYNTFLILIGGSKTDEYYDYCLKNADLVIERLPHTVLPEYFSAVDIYCMVCPKYKAKYGGFGVASMESLACNVPVLSSNLFEAPDEIVSKIGFVVNSESELIDKITYLLQNKDKFKQLRRISCPHFSWEVIAKNIIRLYQKFE